MSSNATSDYNLPLPQKKIVSQESLTKILLKTVSDSIEVLHFNMVSKCKLFFFPADLATSIAANIHGVVILVILTVLILKL